jgi:hypothetical protein
MTRKPLLLIASRALSWTSFFSSSSRICFLKRFSIAARGLYRGESRNLRGFSKFVDEFVARRGDFLRFDFDFKGGQAVGKLFDDDVHYGERFGA